ncbi:hypothetical protein JTB14_017029 [Gonioctena quinquepunctata]|nr:hypothetical protein JTB14_017029 [Gonioctena quinquepunctata]
MKKKTCGKGVTLSADHALCKRPNGSKCEHKCGGEKDSVCGTNGRTYLNRCMLQVEICRLGIALSHVEPCNNISAHRENCPKDCKLVPQDGPVCGSDGNVYKSTCQMKLLTCGQGVNEIKKLRETRFRSTQVRSRERTSHSLSCPTGCKNELEKPTCGSDGFIYRSECELKLLNCANNRRVVKVDFEKYRGRLAKCIKTKCPKDFDPVCGTDARTYTNQCQLNLATCLKSVQFVHVGNCTKLKEQEPCPTSCENETGDEPVCGSDGNVYRSNCHLKKETCGQLVIEVPLHHCRTTASCNEKCTHDRNFVCGSDNFIHLQLQIIPTT